MNICPVLIDSQPSYLAGHSKVGSLLLVPLGTGTLLEYLLSRFSTTVTQRDPVILAPTGADANYARRLKRTCPSARVVAGWVELADALNKYEPSDALLIIDPRCFPVDGFHLDTLFEHASADPRWAIHLVAFDKGVGTKEFVQFDSAGRVRRIQRYYDTVTWPFIKGVAASLLPMSSGILGDEFVPASLWELRGQLTVSGVPSQDLAIEGGAHDLSNEADLLTVSEQFIIDALGARDDDKPMAEPLFVGGGQNIHPTARTIGPVVLHEGATLEANARVVGPALLGANARVGEGAVVAQASVGPGCVVPPLDIVRHRTVFADQLADEPTAPLSFPRRTTYSPPATLAAERESSRNTPEVGTGQAIKRAFDVAFASVFLLLFSPVFAVVAALIRLDSRGRIFYGHPREGRQGRVFRCWKFRTMQHGADAKQRELSAGNLMDGPQFKMKRDPRITRVGRILRATNLDEIPQMINVLWGEMSLVGPRPSPFRENQFCVPWREARLSVPPGITGLWQVCRHDREVSDFHQWIEYDLLYVRHASVLLDLKILLATALTIGGKFHVPLTWMIREDRHQSMGTVRGVPHAPDSRIATVSSASRR